MRSAFFVLAFLAGGLVFAIPASAGVDRAVYTNVKYGYAIEYQLSLLRPQPEPDAGDGVIFVARKGSAKFTTYGSFNVMNDTPDKIASDAEADCLAHRATYRIVKAALVAISCTSAGSVIYQKTIINGDRTATLLANYPATEMATWNPVVAAMARTLKFVTVSYGSPPQIISASKPFAPFLKSIEPAQLNITVATIAVMCHLRSDAWLQPLFVSYQLFIQAQAKKFGVGMDGLDAADIQAQKLTDDLHGKITCQSLLNSETMDRLDALQDKATGGYH